jgi:hypothetical protein
LSLASHLGGLLRALPPLSTDEKAISFDPVQIFMLQRLVRPRLLAAGITIEKADYFKGVIFLDYFTEVIAGQTTILEDIGVLVEELEKLDDYLDVDLELVVRYAALYVLNELKGHRFFRKAMRKQVRKRHLTFDRFPMGNRDADFFHEAVGKLVADMLHTEPVRTAARNCGSASDLRAALFCDAMLEILPPDTVPPEVSPLLRDEELDRTALVLLSTLVEEAEGWSLKAYVEAAQTRLQGGS